MRHVHLWRRRPAILATVLAVLCSWLIAIQASAGVPAAQPNVHVVLWFDTEDYLLPADDDASLRLAQFLSDQGVRATFKLVGEKARVLEQRRRDDVIAALKKHEIGYHTDFHSVQPTIALFLSQLGWDDGVAEFDRRERQGFDDLARIFGQKPSCYGQPGSSWGPQVFGALRLWEVPVYLDAGSHVRLEGRPFWYGGVLNLYALQHTLRTGLADPKDLEKAKPEFQASYDDLIAKGGGVVSIYYHPCEFVHRKFWDGVNFSQGANPPRAQWKVPPQKSAEETATAFANFEGYIRYLKSFPQVKFVTAREALRLYPDRAIGRDFSEKQLRSVAEAVTHEIGFTETTQYALAPSEILMLLNRWLLQRADPDPLFSVRVSFAPFGPTGPPPGLQQDVAVPLEQVLRTAADVDAYFQQHQRVPNAVWLGSVAISPERYLHTIATMLRAQTLPATINLSVEKEAGLATAQYVSEDAPRLWQWVIFPQGFRAPEMMQLAKRQAWTLKPARLTGSVSGPEEYRGVENWPQLPVGLKLGQTSGVAADSKGRVYVFHRGDHPILCFNAEGKLLRYWGDGVIGKSHGLRVDREDNIWVTDVGRHVVRKFSPEGQLLLTLGSEDQPGLGPRQFDQPTDVAFGPKGVVLVSDGYGNSRVAKFSKDGEFLMSWGAPGSQPGQFKIPHSIVVDSKNRVLVGDRENDRIQIFDLQGKLLDVWEGFAPFGLAITPEDDLYVADGRAHVLLHLDARGSVVQYVGTLGNNPGQFNLPHMLDVNRSGNRNTIYVAEITGQRVQQLIQSPQ